MRSIDELSRIATKHGVDFSQVFPHSQAARIAELEQTLGRTDVPFPISTDYKIVDQSRTGYGLTTAGNDRLLDK